MPHKKIRTYTATDQDLDMLSALGFTKAEIDAALAHYHGFSKSGTITSLIKKEFWRIFPAGNRSIRPDRGARVVGRSDES